MANAQHRCSSSKWNGARAPTPPAARAALFGLQRCSLFPFSFHLRYSLRVYVVQSIFPSGGGGSGQLEKNVVWLAGGMAAASRAPSRCWRGSMSAGAARGRHRAAHRLPAHRPRPPAFFQLSVQHWPAVCRCLRYAAFAMPPSPSAGEFHPGGYYGTPGRQGSLRSGSQLHLDPQV